MAARVLRRFPENPKDDEKMYALRYSFPADNLDGGDDATAYIIADSPEEASDAAKGFIVKSNGKRKQSKINEAVLENCRGNKIFTLRAADIALLF